MKLALIHSVKNRSARLALIATASGLIYLFAFTLPFPLPQLYSTIPPVDYTKLTNYSPAGLIIYVSGIVALFWLYLKAIHLTMPRLVDDSRLSLDKISAHPIPPGRFIFLASGGLAIISVFAYPLTAIDLFVYAIRTRGWALYGLNPLATAPETLPTADPWLGLAAEWVDAASPYGPVWELLSVGLLYLSSGDFLAQLLLTKIFMAMVYLGCIWFIYKILQRLYPRWAFAGALAFAWNPAVLLESVQNAHNDIVMILFFLAAIWGFTLWYHLQPYQSSLKSIGLITVIYCSLALSILVKFVTIITVPFFLIGFAMPQKGWLHRLGTMAWSGAIILGLVVAAMIPLWPGQENWAVLEAGSQAGRSLLALLILGLRDYLGTNRAFDLSRNLILLIFSLIYLYHLIQALLYLHSPPHSTQTKSNAHLGDHTQQHDKQVQPDNYQLPLTNYLITPTFSILFWYVLLAAPVFHAWYLLWFIPLAAMLLPRQRPMNATIIFSITALLIIPYFETVRVWYPVLLRNHFLGHLIGVPLLILPPALAALSASAGLSPIRSRFNSEV